MPHYIYQYQTVQPYSPPGVTEAVTFSGGQLTFPCIDGPKSSHMKTVVWYHNATQITVDTHSRAWKVSKWGVLRLRSVTQAQVGRYQCYRRSVGWDVSTRGELERTIDVIMEGRYCWIKCSIKNYFVLKIRDNLLFLYHWTYNECTYK